MFDFGKRLKQIREENNLTQKQFAGIVGIIERGVQRYKMGYSVVTLILISVATPAFSFIVILLSLLKIFNVWTDFFITLACFNNFTFNGVRRKFSSSGGVFNFREIFLLISTVKSLTRQMYQQKLELQW